MVQKTARAAWRSKTRRDFLVAGAAGALGVLGSAWALTRPPAGGIPWPLRSALGANESFWRTIYSQRNLGETPPPPEPGTAARENGDIGLDEEIDPAVWRLRASYPAEGQPSGARGPVALTMDRIEAMPQTEATALFKCIEGWSEPMAYEGVRFSDFLAATGWGTRDGRPWAPHLPPAALYAYVGLMTPDGKYYVSLDMESMLHPKTLLATRLNGVALTVEHGAPLRLMVPVKYGIKSLKRIGQVFFSDVRPPDYWAEQGYDWYAAL